MPTLGMFGGLARRAMQSPRAMTPEERAALLQQQTQAQMPTPSPRPLIGGGMPQAKQNGIMGALGYDQQATGMSPFEWFVSPQSRVDNAKKSIAAQQAAQAQEERMMEMARNANLDPGATLALFANREKFGESYAKNYEAANVGGGDSRTFGNGRQTYTAPKYSMDGGFAVEQGPGGFNVQGQRGPSFDEQNAAFTAVTGRMNADETRRNNDLTNSRGWGQIGVDRDRLAIDRAAAERQAQQEASGGEIFKGPQLATIYNKSMADLDEVKARQGDLDTIANASTQFMDVVRGDDWLQGGGWFNDAMQMGSTRTSEAKKLTDTIAPLIRRPGSGGNSDADVNMFKNSVVNVNNTPQSNKLATEQARALQQRGQQYVDFMTRAIDPRDPQSKQKADALWNKYKAEQSLFDPQTGAVRQVMSFDQWQSKDDVSDLLEKYNR